MEGTAHQDPPGVWHAALPYRSPREFEDAACQFAMEGARAGAAVLIACTSPSLRRIRDRLDGADAHVTWADGNGVGANPGRMIHAIRRFADEQDGRPAWCVQESAWPSRPVDELWEVVRYEALLNRALAGPVRVLCPYPVGLPPQVASCAQAIHPLTAGGGAWEPSPGFSRLNGQPVIPAECDLPLPPPPGDAQVIRYQRELTSVRALVADSARAAGLPPGRASDLLIAVGELTANTLAHSRGPGVLTMWATEAAMVCQVHDGGHIADPLAGQLRPGPAVDSGGRGLWVVHQLCDLVQIRTGPAGTTVRVHMRKRP